MKSSFFRYMMVLAIGAVVAALFALGAPDSQALAHLHPAFKVVGLIGATVGATFPTLLDVSKQFGDNGQPLPLAELLTKTNPILDDIPWVEANSTSGHRLSVRSGYPDAAFRKLNGGVSPSKSNYADVTESMGMCASLGVVDEKLAQLSGNQAKFRMNENVGHIEAMNQKFATTLFYGDTDVSPEQFLGLAPRFDDITGPANAAQIIDAGGNDTDLASIWLIGWGESTVHGIYPKGSQAGLQHKDMGVELIEEGTDTGRYYRALRDWFEWDAGIAVRDWRNIVRIANIDLSALTYNAATGANLIDLMSVAIEQLDNRESVRPVFYVPRIIRSYLRRQITNKANVWLSMDEVAGRKVVAFDGIPVRRVDALLSTESRIV